MTRRELTDPSALATKAPMQGRLWRRRIGIGVLVGGAMTLAGCVSVNAPDKPIVIELNINIKQEVIYRLSADAANTIEQNKEIF